MAEVTRKRTGELLRKLFEILMASPEGVAAGEAIKRLADSVTMSPYEAGVYEPSGTRRFEKIVRFGTVDCVKAGWLVKHKGTWSVTDAGVRAYNTIAEPDAFYREAVRLYQQWRASQPDRNEKPTVEAATEEQSSDKSASITFEEAEEQAWGEIEQFLTTMSPYEFQNLVGDLLKAMGYFLSWIAPPGKDGGVDIIAHTDPLGTIAPRIKVQVKRMASQKVDSDGLKSFMAIINDDDVGLFISVSGFTRDAEGFARSQERRKITLIDLERLVDLWVQFYGKLDDVARQRFPLTPIHFLTPSS
jgi:restriction system protein